MLKRALFVFFLWMFVLFTGQSMVFAQPSSADQILEQLKVKYESIDGLRARFTQTLESEYQPTDASLTGILTMQGDQYRLETNALTVVTDGEFNWVYMVEQNQVTISDYIADETTFSPAQFFVTQPDKYTTTYEGKELIEGVAHHILLLVPLDDNSMISSTRIWVRDSDTLITSIEVMDLNDTRMRFNLEDILLNPEIKKHTFDFEIPQNAEVIDLRS